MGETDDTLASGPSASSRPPRRRRPGAPDAHPRQPGLYPERPSQGPAALSGRRDARGPGPPAQGLQRGCGGLRTRRELRPAIRSDRADRSAPPEGRPRHDTMPGRGAAIRCGSRFRRADTFRSSSARTALPSPAPAVDAPQPAAPPAKSRLAPPRVVATRGRVAVAGVLAVLADRRRGVGPARHGTRGAGWCAGAFGGSGDRPALCRAGWVPRKPLPCGRSDARADLRPDAVFRPPALCGEREFPAEPRCRSQGPSATDLGVSYVVRGGVAAEGGEPAGRGGSGRGGDGPGDLERNLRPGAVAGRGAGRPGRGCGRYRDRPRAILRCRQDRCPRPVGTAGRAGHEQLSLRAAGPQLPAHLRRDPVRAGPCPAFRRRSGRTRPMPTPGPCWAGCGWTRSAST